MVYQQQEPQNLETKLPGLLALSVVNVKRDRVGTIFCRDKSSERNVG